MRFSSLICVDFTNNNFTLSINNYNNVISIGHSDKNAHGHKEKKIFPFKQIETLTNIKMISCGYYHSICLDYDGNIYSFGFNNYGQLGINNNYYELEQTHIPQQINLPPCKQVSCGDHCTLCLTEDNELYSFGNNYYGQLGIGNNIDYSSPQLIPDLNDIEYVICGGNYSICKTYNNDFYSWGDNEYGQLGQGNYDDYSKPIQCLNWPNNIIDIKCGMEFSLLLTSEGLIYSFGDNSSSQLGINDENIETINTPRSIEDIPEIQRIECGYYHALCMDINDNLWCFGNNTNGQLGLGDTKNRCKPTLNSTVSNIIDISSGGHHAFVKTIDNKIYAFGYNGNSQLGIEIIKENQVTPIQVLEDNEDIWCSTIGKSRAKSARK